MFTVRAHWTEHSSTTNRAAMCTRSSRAFSASRSLRHMTRANGSERELLIANRPSRRRKNFATRSWAISQSYIRANTIFEIVESQLSHRQGEVIDSHVMKNADQIANSDLARAAFADFESQDAFMASLPKVEEMKSARAEANGNSKIVTESPKDAAPNRCAYAMPDGRSPVFRSPYWVPTHSNAQSQGLKGVRAYY